MPGRAIDPAEWLTAWSQNHIRAAAAETSEKVTPWFSGAVEPVWVGYYDRMFTDGLFRHWWNGREWLANKDWPVPHWRQVGDYPCWRGLRSAAQPHGKEGA